MIWTDEQWVKGTAFITDSKWKRYGKGIRVIPLDKDLRMVLEKQFELADTDGIPFVVDCWRDTSKNLRTHFLQIIRRAGWRNGRDCFISYVGVHSFRGIS